MNIFDRPRRLLQTEGAHRWAMRRRRNEMEGGEKRDFSHIVVRRGRRRRQHGGRRGQYARGRWRDSEVAGTYQVSIPLQLLEAHLALSTTCSTNNLCDSLGQLVLPQLYFSASRLSPRRFRRRLSHTLPETHGSASPHASVSPTSASPTFTSLDLENDDVPNFYEDFVTHATAEDLQPSTSTGIASSSSSAPSTSAFVATFSTWAPPPPPPPVTVPAQGPTPALAATPSAPLLNDDEGESVYYMPPPPRLQVPPTSHRFQRMGKGRGN
ncbi:hypothetical protein R3P38DRAFT_3227792 [Favolaschia claudopus]|uniref:Uncharacterized protein n=1 Tax=Favolaschia claudopus TaxID=2862362 RepID=A0AAV9ZRF4_9AGAR